MSSTPHEEPGAPHGGAEPVAAEIRGLSVETEEGHLLVDDVSLRLRPGTVTALIGASGSGKTTTGLSLLGEYPAGARVTGEVRADAGGVGYVPQHPGAALNPARRAGALLHDIAARQVRALRLPRRERRAEAGERVLRALEAAQLADGERLLGRYPHQLSGGQQQRVVLAQALLRGTRTVVADEPTTGQDALTKQRVVAELARLARRGIAVLLLSHDLDVVRELADEVVVLREGRVVERGPAARVRTAPRHPWTRELFACAGTDAYSARAAAPGSGPDAPAPALRAHIREARYRDRERGTVHALRDARLTVSAGECLAVVGRSGSGKTTLGRCLAGLHRDWDGEAVPAGGVPLPHSVRARDAGQLAAVQYVFQDAAASFDEHRPVLWQVARTAVRLRGAAPATALEEARAGLARVGLDAELAERRPGRLSGGELQRAALARALLARPGVLVCDEITSGLDMLTRRAVLDVLTGLLDAPGGPALVLITHDLPTAALAHHVAVLDGGVIVEQGPAAQVLETPAHPFTASLVEAARKGTTEAMSTPR
ncbi:ATP-binding cassette domain-containing protein [Streptomyces sp. HNM0574]|uniref:ABC transporter ATP-binding protein n=1 Tax=Streptomyces sp. HNM0574 TaxID=2714954 RepID=UPI00146F29CC|nr:ATP-binding cassette domain-containing protein [Streptomyces sp. HNM0574]NLU65917.1 ABC transporter ATP-binding protein [Streptomyces sp. HNM0574]